VRVVRSDTDTLQLTRRAFELPPGGAVIAAVFCALFAGGWYAYFAFMFGNRIAGPFPADLVFAFFTMMILLVGFMPLGVASLALWGEARVDVGRTEIVSRVSIGRFGITQQVRTSDVEFVGAEGDQDNPRWRSPPQRTIALCKVRAGAKTISLWIASTPPTCFALAELIRRRLPTSLSRTG
jgi:hypothetical protein